MSVFKHVKGGDNAKGAGPLVAAVCGPLFLLFYGISYSVRSPHVYFMDVEKAILFFLALGAVSGLLRCFSNSLGRVFFQGYCMFMIVASVTLTLAAPFLMEPHERSLSRVLMFCLIYLVPAYFFWRVRTADQNAWREHQK
jgi:hypothetical protein